MSKSTSKKRIRVVGGKDRIEDTPEVIDLNEPEVANLEEVMSPVDEGNPIHPEEPESEEQEPETPTPEIQIAQPTSVGQVGKSIPMTYASLESLGMSKVQIYSILSMMVFADCSVQKSPDGIFDVLARNFETAGSLTWWLNRIGFGEKAKYAHGRDLIDYIRKIAHELYRDLKEVAKPVARF